MRTAGLALLVALFMVWHCREPRTVQPVPAGGPAEEAAAVPPQTLASLAENTEEDAAPKDFSKLIQEYAALLPRLADDSARAFLTSQIEILKQPADPRIKRAGLEKQFNGQEFFSVGLGKSNPRLPPAQNRALVSRAALTDALRWMAYFKYWQENNFKKSFGSLPDLALPGYEEVKTLSLSDGSAVMVIKMRL